MLPKLHGRKICSKSNMKVSFTAIKDLWFVCLFFLLLCNFTRARDSLIAASQLHHHQRFVTVNLIGCACMIFIGYWGAEIDLKIHCSKLRMHESIENSMANHMDSWPVGLCQPVHNHNSISHTCTIWAVCILLHRENGSFSSVVLFRTKIHIQNQRLSHTALEHRFEHLWCCLLFSDYGISKSKCAQACIKVKCSNDLAWFT